MPEPPRPAADVGVRPENPGARAASLITSPPEHRPFSGPWERFRHNRAAVAALALLALMCLACFATLGWSAGTMRVQHLDAARQPPSRAYVLGTDELGRSLMWRTLYGGAISLSLGVLAAGVSVVIGTAYGLIAGYIGGRWDELMMRAVDVLYTLPYMLLVMLFAVSIGAWLEGRRLLGGEWSRFFVLALAIGGVSWLTMARVVRGQVLSLREQPFVEAARALGLPTTRILLRHLLPSLAGPILVFGTLIVPQAILQESFLSFLGVGVQPPQATWGSLAADGVHLMNPVQFDWWLVLVPCVALSVTLLALNFVGDGIRDAIDVRSSR